MDRSFSCWLSCDGRQYLLLLVCEQPHWHFSISLYIISLLLDYDDPIAPLMQGQTDFCDSSAKERQFHPNGPLLFHKSANWSYTFLIMVASNALELFPLDRRPS